MRHPHPVERALVDAERRGEVGVDVEVDEPNVLVHMTGDRAELDCAVPAEHEEWAPLLARPGHAVCRLTSDARHLSQVLGPRACGVRSPAPDRRVAQIRHLHAAGAQPIDEAGLAQRRRGQLLPRREGAGAGRDAEQSERRHQMYMPPNWPPVTLSTWPCT